MCLADLQAYQHVYVAMSITTTKAASASQKLTSSAGFASVNVRPNALMPQACAPPLLKRYMPSSGKSCDMTQAPQPVHVPYLQLCGWTG